MIGRGSRILNNKSTFSIIDLGNNTYRFGPWGADLDWQAIFRMPNYYLDQLLNDEELESNFRHEMPDELRKKFMKSEEVYFDIKATYIAITSKGETSKKVLEQSIAQHAKICIENSEDIYDALSLAQLLDDDIDYRIEAYAKCISRSTNNFLKWLKDDYGKKLRVYLRENFDVVFEEIHGYPPEE